MGTSRNWLLVGAIACIGGIFACWRPAATAQPTGPKSGGAACRQPQVEFHSVCVEPGDCCDSSLCSAGEVFEFVKAPKCTPCAEARTQAGISYCAANAAATGNGELTALYKTLVEKFPAERERLQAAERAWMVFRDRFCDARAGFFSGGSVESAVKADCLEAETRKHVQRLKDLRDEWSNH